MGSGYLTAYLFGMMVPLLLMVFAISYGARLVAGEEDRGTLDLLAALPVSRTRVLLVKAAALLVTLGLLGVALVITVIAAAPLVDLRVEIAGLAAAVLSQVLLAALYGALALGLGAALAGTVWRSGCRRRSPSRRTWCARSARDAGWPRFIRLQVCPPLTQCRPMLAIPSFGCLPAE